MIVILPSTSGRSPVDQHYWLERWHDLWDTAIFWNWCKSWYIWKCNLAEGVGLQSKVEPPSCQVRTMPPRRAPQPSKCQTSTNQQGPPICQSWSRKWNWIVIWVKFLCIKILLDESIIENWIKLTSKYEAKPSQAKPSQTSPAWNEVRVEMLIVSRTQDPEAWGRVCRIVTVSLEHSQSLQMIHVSCPLETKKQGLTKFFEQV